MPFKFREGFIMIINHNMLSANANRQLGINNTNLSKATEKLSSGLRINRAGDDAAGLSISEKMRGQIRGLDQASTNAQDGISMIQTAEGALDETHSILQRMRELAVQANNGTLETEDQTAVKAEVDALISELDRIGDTTQFNKKNLLDGSTATVTLQVGANEGQTMDITLQSMKAGDLGVDAIDVTTAAGAAITSIDSAIESVSSFRSSLGAYQNRLEHTIKNLDNASENLQAAESRIRDVDMAKEMTEFTKNQVLQQASQAMLAQANQIPSQVLSLLR